MNYDYNEEDILRCGFCRKETLRHRSIPTCLKIMNQVISILRRFTRNSKLDDANDMESIWVQNFA